MQWKKLIGCAPPKSQHFPISQTTLLYFCMSSQAVIKASGRITDKDWKPRSIFFFFFFFVFGRADASTILSIYSTLCQGFGMNTNTKQELTTSTLLSLSLSSYIHIIVYKMTAWVALKSAHSMIRGRKPGVDLIIPSPPNRQKPSWQYDQQ